MNHLWKKWMLWGSMAAAFVLTGCTEAQADKSEEAASADWTETQIEEAEKNIDDTEERIDELAKDIQALQGKPLFSEEPFFPDVDKKYHAFEEIQYLFSQNIISGFPEGHFGPGQTITRAQTAKMLTTARGLEAPADYEIKAEDVSLDHHAYDALAALEYHDIMSGIDGKLLPGEGLKRSQMAALLVKVYELPPAETIHSFKDIGEDYPNFEEINIIADQQITSEVGKDFRPNETTTRAQFSLFMARTMEDYFKQ